MSTIRLRRLAADYEKLRTFIERHPRLKLLNVNGEPPESYQIEYRIRSMRQTDDELKVVTKHTVEIVLPRDYPRTPPQCRMLTPVFHPNIAPHAICVGDHWSAGEPIGSIVARIGEMLAYQSYNTKSPLNGEAARWVEQNLEQLPLDDVNMLAESSPATGVTPNRPAKPAVPKAVTQTPVPPVQQAAPVEQVAPVVSFSCPQCQERYKAPAEFRGKRTRCKKCQTIIAIPEADPNP